ncbi:hypothetical protein [Chitinivorax sp. B]|uniref:hypothetical protein n=1 Tax=Chitinivorax sp. B TaxID=2502235 RepID=UPI0010F4FB2F|nr:hypothetical protein [Chitinivorax sp. B]
MKIRFTLALLSMSATLPVLAGNLNTMGNLNQREFRSLAEDAVAAYSYRGVTPATPLGLLGFDVGVGLSYTDAKHDDLWKRANDGKILNSILIPRLHLHKGLPMGLDLGVSLGKVIDADTNLIGAEARYALVEGGLATPAVGLRLSASTTQGNNSLKFRSAGAELLISKTLTLFTPYVGIGYVWSKTDTNAHNLTSEKVNKAKLLMGGNLNLGLLNIAAEADTVGDIPSASVKLGWRF